MRHAHFGLAVAGLTIGLAACIGSPAAIAPSTSAPTRPTALPQLFHDELTAAAAGRPTLQEVSVSGPNGVHINSYALAATLPATPSEAKLYSVDPAKAPTLRSVAAALGVADPRKVPINYTPETGYIQFSPPLGAAQLSAGGPITDATSAIKFAGVFLYQRGFFSKDEVANMTGSAKRFSYPPNPPFWSVRLVRDLGGTPSEPFWSGAGASLQLQESGLIQTLTIKRSPISGNETGTLIDAATAWQQVKAGHGVHLTGLANGPANVPTFQADTAELCYLEGSSWVLPMWCFADNTSLGADYPMWLFYPALKPGTFDWQATG